MSIASLALGQAPVAAQQPQPASGQTPPRRRTVAKADAVTAPEPR